MAKRFADTDIWDKEWFMNLSCKHKCLMKYIFDKCDVAGIWTPNWTLASQQIKEPVTKADLDFVKNQIEELPNGKIFIPDFISFQYGKLSEKCKPHEKIIQILKKYNLFDRVSKGYIYPIHTLQEKDKDKEEEMETEKEEEFGKSENLLTIVPKMCELWYMSFQTYTKDRKNDFEAMGKVLQFMIRQPKCDGNIANAEHQIKILNTLQLIADQVNREPFWVNKPIKSIANNIQEFYNNIKNPINGNGKSITGKQNSFSREGIQTELNERLKGRK